MKKLTIILSVCLWAVAIQAQNFGSEAMRKLQMAEFAISNFYVDKVDEDKLVEEAIIKMLAQLDPHSTYSDAEEVKKMELPKAIPEDIKQVIAGWQGMLSQLTGISKTYLKKALPSLGPNGSLLLVFEDPNAYSYIVENRSGCQDNLRMMIAERIGKEVEIQVKQNETGHPSGEVSGFKGSDQF